MLSCGGGVFNEFRSSACDEEGDGGDDDNDDVVGCVAIDDNEGGIPGNAVTPEELLDVVVIEGAVVILLSLD